MANIKIIDLPTGSPESTSFVEATQVDELAESGRATVKLALNALGNYVAGQGASPLEYGDLETESTTLIGAANELHNTIGADAYDDTATYNTGDYCIYGGELYKCNDDNVTGAWDAAKWDATILVDELGGSGSSLVLPESIAAEYDDTASYTAGDFVMYQGILYKCNHISATGSFDPTKWDAISAIDYINSVKSSLTTNINHLAADLSDAYSSSNTYAVGDLCTTPEAWTPAHWTTTTVKAELAALNYLSDIKRIEVQAEHQSCGAGQMIVVNYTVSVPTGYKIIGAWDQSYWAGVLGAPIIATDSGAVSFNYFSTGGFTDRLLRAMVVLAKNVNR